jgi:hypothetical protein
MHMPIAGFAVVYRWRLHPGMEEQFVKGWTRLSEIFLHQQGSLGSRLHRGPEGIWYSYAQWPSAVARENAFASGSPDIDASNLMQAAIAETFPEIVLEPVVDLMVATRQAST